MHFLPKFDICATHCMELLEVTFMKANIRLWIAVTLRSNLITAETISYLIEKRIFWGFRMSSVEHHVMADT